VTVCGAANDKLLDDDLTVEHYSCVLEFGHAGPHKSPGYPGWWDDSYHEANDFVAKDSLVTKTGKTLTDADIEALADEAAMGYAVEHLKGKPNRPDLATRALKAMLPSDAADVADVLDGMVHKPKGWLVSDCERENLLRAVEILRGEP